MDKIYFYRITSFLNVLLTFLTILSIGGSLADSSFKKFTQVETLRNRITHQIKLTGHPYLRNCNPDKAKAINSPFLIRHSITLAPEWSNNDEFDNHPDILKYYSWSYQAKKTEVDPITRELTNITKYFDITAYKSSQNSDILYFPSYSATPGLYTVTFKAAKKSTNRYKLNDPNGNTCYYYVRLLRPVPVIEGGFSRIIPNNIDLKMNGKLSTDPNTPLSSNMFSVKFKWECLQKNNSATICGKNPVSREPEFIIPKTKIRNGDEIVFKLIVTNRFGAKRSTEQSVSVKANAAALIIRCAKNCPPINNIPNVEKITFFRVLCDKNCEGIYSQDYYWSIRKTSNYEKFKFDYENSTTFGRIGQKFVIKENALEPSTSYNIIVALSRKSKRFGRAEYNLKYGKEPGIEKCNIFPPAGRSLETLFRLECVELPPADMNNFYELYVDTRGAGTIVSGFYPNIFYSRFYLPPSEKHRFAVTISKISQSSRGPSISFDLNPQVVSSTDNKTSAEALKIYNDFYKQDGETISELISSNDPKKRENGIEKFQALVDEIINSKLPSNHTEKFAHSFTTEIIEKILDVDTNQDGIQALLKLTDGVTKLIARHQLTQIDPYLAYIASTLCKLLAEQHAKNTENLVFPEESDDEELQKITRKCVETTSVDESLDLMAPIKRNITVKEIPSISLDTPVEEDYPDYIDFTSDYVKKLEMLHDITRNLITAVAASAKSLAMTMAKGEDYAKRSGRNSATIVAKDEGKILVSTRIQLLDTVLIPSKDFQHSDHDFDIFMTIWTTDLFWWNHAKTRIASNTLSIQFWHSGCKKRIRHFNSSASISLKVKNETNFNVKQIIGNVTVPNNYTNMTEEELNRYIRVYRVAFPRSSVLFLDFHKTTHEGIFDVAVPVFEYPTMKHFKRNYTVNNKNITAIQVTNNHNYDKWVYVGILVNRKYVTSAKSKTLHFNVSVVATFCVRWHNDKRAWQLDCTPGKTERRDVISCRCRHFSVLAGYMQNTEAIVQTIHTIDIELELQVFYVIFATLAITWGVFCLLILLSLFRKKPGIYFLADNKKDDLYAYLVIVRTDNQRHSGTTSNITIRVIGSKRNSEPHVLNYPDPKLRLLQKEGEDIFVMTTPRHLGDVKKIELWSDSTGASPSWFCRDIVIYDMQRRHQWFFRIRKLFTVLKGGVTYLITQPTDKEPPGFFNQFRICNQFHTWQLWAIESSYSYTARLTTVFSNALMNYVFVLWMMGTPTFTLKDCFDPYETYVIYWYHVNLAGVCGFCSFVIHCFIAWVYRFSDIAFTVRDKQLIVAHPCSWCCWVLLFLMIIFSTMFLLIYGFFVPTTSGFIWLTCALCGLLLDIIFYENIFIAIQTFFCKFKLTIFLEKRFDSILRNIEGQRVYLYTKFDAALMRPYLQHLYEPLEKMQLVRRRIISKLRRSIYNDLEDLVLYGVYNILLYVMVLLNKGALTVISKDQVESMVEGKHTRTLSFSEMKSFAQVFNYINNTLIPVMQPTIWYTNYSISDAGLMIDNANKFIGVARLRQLRTPANCKIPEVMSFLNFSQCLPEYSLHNEETANFGPKWSDDYTDIPYDRLSSIWQYATHEETETWLALGQLASYSGGGYLAFLGRTLTNSYINLNRIKEQFWIDDRSRGLFIEFLTYNANYNLFVAVRLLFEQSATGYSRGSSEVNVVRMLYVENEIEIMTMIFFVLFVFWITMLMLKLIFRVFKYIGSFYKRIWLMIDLIINTMSLICIILFAVRVKMVESYLGDLERLKHNEFVSYFDLLIVEEFLTYFFGILICIATARLWRFLRFGLFFRVMEKTLSIAAFPLFGTTLGFVIILTAFGLAGIIIFNNEFLELGFFVKIVGTLIQMALKPDQFDLTEYTGYQLSYAYFTLYLICMQVILLIYVTVVIMAYMKAQLELSVEPDSYTVQIYLREQMEHMPKLIKTKLSRLRGGDTETSPVTSKADEFRYANSVAIRQSQIKSMAFIASCIFRNMTQGDEEQAELTEYETQMMLDVCRSLILKRAEGDDVDLFFKGHFEGQKIQMIPEKKIDNIADIVRLMFRKKPDKEEAPKDNEELVVISRSIRRQNLTLKKCNLLLKLISLNLDEVELL